MRFPQSVADDCRAARDSVPELLLTEAASDGGRHVQGRLDALRLQDDTDPFGGVAADQRHVGAAEPDDAFEYRRLAQHQDVARRHVERVQLSVGAHHRITDPDQAFRRGEWQGPQQHVIDRAEDRRIRADAKCQNRDGDAAVARRSPDEACRIAQILPEPFHSHLRPIVDVIFRRASVPRAAFDARGGQSGRAGADSNRGHHGPRSQARGLPPDQEARGQRLCLRADRSHQARRHGQQPDRRHHRRRVDCREPGHRRERAAADRRRRDADESADQVSGRRIRTRRPRRRHRGVPEDRHRPGESVFGAEAEASSRGDPRKRKES